MENDVRKYATKIGQMLTQEMLEDVNLRFDAMSLLKEREMAKIANLSDREKRIKFNGVVDRISEMKGLSRKEVVRKVYLDVLTNIHGKDSEKMKRAQRIINDDDPMKLDIWIAEEVNKLDPKTRTENEDKEFIPRMFLTSILNGAPEILDAQTDRYVKTDEQPARKYCLRATTLSLHKQNARYGIFDFLPEKINDSISNRSFINHIEKKYPEAIFDVGEYDKVGDFIDAIDIKPGALVVLRKKNDESLHALLYTHQKDGVHYTTGFNPELKERKSSHYNDALIIDLPELIKTSVFKAIANKTKEEQMQILKGLEEKITAESLRSKNFKDAVKEGKKYSPEEQWNTFYKREDVVSDTKAHVNERKLILQKRRER
ncbi:MAG: hypothetical protein R3Y43_07095 [Alphaproteobacteria bacterium]